MPEWNRPGRVLPALVLPVPFDHFLRALAQRHQVYIVGGWLRDALRGQPPHDADFATDADAEEVARLAASAGLRIFADQVAAQHGTYRMTSGRSGEVLDLATLRRDVARQGARHAEVAFTAQVHEDLARRDLTINGMAATFPLASDGPTPIIDPFGGQRDLERRCLRLIGVPHVRLQEDPLRLLRVARFAAMAQNYRIAPTTRRALRARGGWLRQVSFERMRDELHKAMALPCAHRFWQVAHRAGVLPCLWPMPMGFCWRRGSRALKRARHRAGSSLAKLILFALAGASAAAGEREQREQAEGARHCLRRLRVAKDEAEAVARALAAFPWRPQKWHGQSLARWLLRHGTPAIAACREATPALVAAHLVAKAPLDALWRRVDQLLGGRPIPTLRDLAVDGHALTKAGLVTDGPALGALLQHLLQVGLCSQSWHDADALMAHARQWQRERSP